MYCGFLLAAECLAQTAGSPHTITWREAQDRFRANNPSLLAGQVTIDEARADEITAYLRPNPDFTLATDGSQIAPSQGVWRPLAGTLLATNLSYLHERRHKHELRLESAQKETAITMSAQADLERNLIFNLRDAFVRVLLAKAVVSIAKENLDYYDKSLSINRDRYSAGAIAHVDLQRLELQRVQFVSDLATAQVNLRTAKIDLQALLRPQFRAGRESIGDIRLLAPSGERVSLGQVADIQFRDGASQIYRENNSRYVAIKYSVRGRDLGSTVEEAIRTVVSRW